MPFFFKISSKKAFFATLLTSLLIFLSSCGDQETTTNQPVMQSAIQPPPPLQPSAPYSTQPTLSSPQVRIDFPEIHPENLDINLVENGHVITKVKKGQAFFIKVHSKKDGYLLLLDENAKGELIQLYPNQFLCKIDSRHPCQAGYLDTFIRAGESRFIPENSSQGYDISADEIGFSKMYAVLINHQNDWNQLQFAQESLQIIQNPQAFIEQLTDESLQRSVKELNYTVIP